MPENDKSQPPQSEELRAKFREALDRKQAGGGVNARGRGRGKVAGPHRSETSGAEQMFRRKSGS
ncbi:DUF5302 domain-containing protein [Nocardioides sp. R-C-SC26]|uniref:DUF5302 domain-containing protein n=1 Tax=Nocardioides sp. R-C-SC26 TaxID=2870414 RepID=UPI001E370D58|nr:DUF5302 domain-containing protein [Nocardioides sp. R-C-SC26]